MNSDRKNVSQKTLKDAIHHLIDVASERPAQERDVLLDHIIEAVLRGETSGMLSASKPSSAVAKSTTARPVTYAATEQTNSKTQPGRPGVKTAPGMKTASLSVVSRGKEEVPGKRGRGRPRKHAVPKYDIKYPCLYLMDHFQIEEPRTRKQLEKIAVAAREKGGGRGIPQTEAPENYRFLRRGGPVPSEYTFKIAGMTYRQTAPIVSKGSNGITNAIWIEFEKMVMGIQDVRLSPEEAARKEHEISYAQGVRATGMKWHEAAPSSGEGGIPTITAESAREILRASKAFSTKESRRLLDTAPAGWLQTSSDYTDEFSAIVRRIVLGEVPFSRRERFAISRLLMAPLGSLESDLFWIAFPERFKTGEVKSFESKRA